MISLPSRYTELSLMQRVVGRAEMPVRDRIYAYAGNRDGLDAIASNISAVLAFYGSPAHWRLRDVIQGEP